MKFDRIGVVGGGSWGTALALVAARAGRTVMLYARDRDAVAAINKTGQSPRLPGITLDPPLTATTGLEEVLGADAVLLVTPAQTTRKLALQMRPFLAADTPVVLCAKGLEHGSGALLTDVLNDALPQATAAVLSGPSFASDVAQGLPTAVTIASEDAALADNLARALASDSFRPYFSTDVIGVQIGGALKNVLAIPCGAIVGRGLGASAQAALIARGFAELSRLAKVMGVRTETLSGLSGLGDLVLTSSSPQSRNMAFGIEIGRGHSVAELTGPGTKLVEGVHTAPVAVKLGKRRGVELPICEAVAAVLEDTLSVDEALQMLMSRPLKRES
ncbi:NAD(P)H-dependent glycerol-3-phosphate dehydrogenase [Breoghania sp.]|uniref:NAD(P)H-dependent glycerol-3-phosphate dehydrogenase n=1 Tax=Breoghania sp. TaxID=2065378 RepID=UPI00261D5861|nr:NAD(P)H-dependent glycerol-3-phosphate dehydrogenase [Breoghania sp.]MDJ0930502.1 NAD(P)H-dependent glycerol-3-phosphate dehydrogenase [Breoghania sp.]